MLIASMSGSRRASRLNWRTCVRSSSRAAPGARRPRQPFASLLAALRALVRFHKAHPDWFPPLAEQAGSETSDLPPVDPQLPSRASTAGSRMPQPVSTLNFSPGENDPKR